jgi:single-strand DNA-binding protein
MAASNINRVIITGNLTKDPELHRFDNGGCVVTLRIACNTRKKSGDEWVDKPNYFDVKVWNKQGENAQKYLAKGRGVAVDGRLEWREFTTQAGDKRQTVEIVADNVQFLSNGQNNGGSSEYTPAPSDGPAPGAPGDDDMPF